MINLRIAVNSRRYKPAYCRNFFAILILRIVETCVRIPVEVNSMLFKRKIYDKFLAWKTECAGKKALLVEGARRIGKSTVVEEFAKNEYKSYILIDFAKASSDVKEYFQLYLNDLDTFFMLLSVQYGVQLHERDSVIIFDEVQLFPKARMSRFSRSALPKSFRPSRNATMLMGIPPTSIYCLNRSMALL